MEEILKRYRNAKYEMADCKALIEESRGINARSSVKGSGTSSYKGSSVESSVLQIESLVNRWYDLDYFIRDIDIMIQCLPSQEQRLIKRRYIDGVKIAQIAREIGLTDAQARAMHKNAIKILEYLLRDKKETYYKLLGVHHPTT